MIYCLIKPIDIMSQTNYFKILDPILYYLRNKQGINLLPPLIVVAIQNQESLKLINPI